MTYLHKNLNIRICMSCSNKQIVINLEMNETPHQQGILEKSKKSEGKSETKNPHQQGHEIDPTKHNMTNNHSHHAEPSNVKYNTGNFIYKLKMNVTPHQQGHEIDPTKHMTNNHSHHAETSNVKYDTDNFIYKLKMHETPRQQGKWEKSAKLEGKSETENPHQQGPEIDPTKHMKNNDSHHAEPYYVKCDTDDNNIVEKVLIILSTILVIITLPFSLFYIFENVRLFERIVILRNGKVYKNEAFGPGLVRVLPCVDTIHHVDLRIACYEVPPQHALTKDSLTVSVDAVLFYKIDNPISAIVNIADFNQSTHLLAATSLRNAIGTRNLVEVLVDRPAVSKQVYELMKNVTEQWGVNVARVEIKDIRLPLQLQKAMAAEAESSKIANAKIIVAKAEIETINSLKRATEMLMDNPMCMQLRYLQLLQSIAGDHTHTIVFPFSVDQVRSILKK